MADDPRRTVLSQWRGHVQETGDVSLSAPAPPTSQLRTRRASPPVAQRAPPAALYAHARPQPQPPSQSSAPHTNGRAALHQQQFQPQPQYATGRTRHAYADDERKGADVADPLDEHAVPRESLRKRPTRSTATSTATATTAPTPQPPPPHRPTRESDRDAHSRQQREKQRHVQMQLARIMDAQRNSSIATPASSGVAYYELVSPARPVLNAHGGVLSAAETNGHVNSGNQANDEVDDDDDHEADHAVAYATQGQHGPPARRVSPSDVMQELDEDFRRSFNEHQRATDDEQDEAEQDGEADDAFPGHAHGRGGSRAYASPPPPVMPVRVQQQNPHRSPFIEELSSDLSDHASTTHAPSPPSNDLGGVHFPMSNGFDSIPSISLTPPASPTARRSRPPPSNATTNVQGPSSLDQRHGSPKHDDAVVVFPTWSIGFLAGCIVIGLGGLFMDELMQWTGVFTTTSPFALSRIEQREMNRRLDLLQQELRSFRVAAHEIEQQSQRMVHEVRGHLEKMKSERERHQQMISKEMDALRRYVQAVTTELVEDEKKEIRKRLLETIADTIVELPDDLDEDALTVPSGTNKGRDATQPTTRDSPVPSKPTGEGDRPAVDTLVEVAIAAAESDATVLFNGVDEAAVMQQIDQATAKPPAVAHVPTDPTVASTNAIEATADASSSSLLSLELLALLTGVALIAGLVGLRVRNATRRKPIYRNRKPIASFLQRFAVKKAPIASTEESDVETVSFFRSDAEDDDTDHRSTGPSEDEARTEYSEEEKEGEPGDDQTWHDGYQESVSMSSNGDEYEFQAAELSGDVASNHSDVESIDESPSTSSMAPPTPYPRMREQLHERLSDDSPSVRRSPRIQVRSSLSHMR